MWPENALVEFVARGCFFRGLCNGVCMEFVDWLENEVDGAAASLEIFCVGDAVESPGLLGVIVVYASVAIKALSRRDQSKADGKPCVNCPFLMVHFLPPPQPQSCQNPGVKTVIGASSPRFRDVRAPFDDGDPPDAETLDRVYFALNVYIASAYMLAEESTRSAILLGDCFFECLVWSQTKSRKRDDEEAPVLLTVPQSGSNFTEEHRRLVMKEGMHQVSEADGTF